MSAWHSLVPLIEFPRSNPEGSHASLPQKISRALVHDSRDDRRRRGAQISGTGIGAVTPQDHGQRRDPAEQQRKPIWRLSQRSPGNERRGLNYQPDRKSV